MATESSLLRFLTTTTVPTGTWPGRPVAATAARRSARPAPCAASPAGPVACPAESGSEAAKEWTVIATARAAKSCFGRIAKNLSCSREASLGASPDEEPIAERRAGTLGEPEGAEMRRRGEVEPRVRRVERAHVQRRAGVLDQVL